jgi:hypothetical protein
MGRYRTVTDLASFCRHIGNLNIARTEGEEDADLPDVVDLTRRNIGAPEPVFTMLEECCRQLADNRNAPVNVDGFGLAYQVALPPAQWRKVQMDPAFIAASERGDVRDSDKPWWDGGVRIDRHGRRVPFFDSGAGQRFLLMRAPKARGLVS